MNLFKKIFEKLNAEKNQSEPKLDKEKEEIILEKIEKTRNRDIKITRAVNIDNALVNAAQGLLLSEKRIIMLAVIKMQSQKELKYTEEPIVLEASEFASIYDIETHTAYEQIKKSCHSMIKKQVIWYQKSEKGIEKIEVNWVSDALYSKGKGHVLISFTPKIQKFLLQLKNHFTTYHLQQTKAFRSIYSWRLFEVLSQFKSTGWRQIGLEKFCHIMESTEKTKSNFNNIRKRILEPAVKEIKEKAKWEIEWRTIKKGKKVVSIIFSFKAPQ